MIHIGIYTPRWIIFAAAGHTQAENTKHKQTLWVLLAADLLSPTIAFLSIKVLFPHDKP